MLTGSVLTSAQDAAFGGTFNFTTTPPNATCMANASNFTCTLSFQLPPGNDTLSATLYDGANATGNVLSEQSQTLSLVAGEANAFGMTFDANPSALVLNGSGNCASGVVGTAFGSTGTTAVTFSATYTDADSKSIVGPGLPTLAILGNDANYHSDSGTIAGTGGTVAFAIDQTHQTFTLTPSNSSVTGASVAIKVTPANSAGSNDGLSFSLMKSFTFSTGAAPPAHFFLAAVEQANATSGKVDFFNMTVGGPGSSDSFTAFSPASLAVTNSSNEGKPDVDNPQSIAWDSTGDLLIGNAATGAVDAGNIACVPAGAISSGANTATTVSTYVSDPVGLAYDSREPSIAIANEQPGADYNLAEYLSSGNYVAAPTTRDLKVSVANLGATGVADLSTLTAGTYAVALTDGSEIDTARNGNTRHTSEIALVAPNGTTFDIDGGATTPTAYAVDRPAGLAFDAATNELVISNESSFHKNLSFYSVAGGPSATQTQVIATGHRNFTVATSPDGHVAVAWNSSIGSGYQQVQVYDNATPHAAVGAPIPFNGTAADCATYTFGTSPATVNSLTWLSNDKLLVALETDGSPAQNGLYVYDISKLTTPAGYDDQTCSPFAAAAPTESAFHSIATKPLGTAYKP